MRYHDTATRVTKIKKTNDTKNADTIYIADGNVNWDNYSAKLCSMY